MIQQFCCFRISDSTHRKQFTVPLPVTDARGNASEVPQVKSDTPPPPLSPPPAFGGNSNLIPSLALRRPQRCFPVNDGCQHTGFGDQASCTEKAGDKINVPCKACVPLSGAKRTALVSPLSMCKEVIRHRQARPPCRKRKDEPFQSVTGVDSRNSAQGVNEPRPPASPASPVSDLKVPRTQNHDSPLSAAAQ